MELVQTNLTRPRAQPLIVDNERDLVERAKHDANAFSLLYRCHYQPVASHVYRRTGDEPVPPGRCRRHDCRCLPAQDVR